MVKVTVVVPSGYRLVVRIRRDGTTEIALEPI